MTSLKTKKRLEICRRCGGYMKEVTTFKGDANRNAWHRETSTRSFGGIKLGRFSCEACGFIDTFQVDQVENLIEED